MNSNLTLLECIYDSLRFRVKITLSKVWNMYIIHRVQINSYGVKMYSVSNVHILHFQKCEIFTLFTEYK